MKSEWFTIKEKVPTPGSYILVELDRCKCCEFVSMIIREGEGLGHIKRWKYLENLNKKEKLKWHSNM